MEGEEGVGGYNLMCRRLSTCDLVDVFVSEPPPSRKVQDAGTFRRTFVKPYPFANRILDSLPLGFQVPCSYGGDHPDAV